MIRKKVFAPLAIILPLLFLVCSCKTSEHLAYFQDLKDTSKTLSVSQYPYEPVKLQTNDEIQVLVSSATPEASQAFNFTSGAANISSGALLNAYRVNPNGVVTLPVLGDMYVVGLTTFQVKEKITKALEPYLKDAVVLVRLTNFKVTVIGEVTSPVVVPVDGERINVLEAIGAAGDMTVFSKRFNVKVMRRGTNTMEVGHLNFNSSKMMQSPFFQLQQNDVVYIEPELTKGVSAERVTIFLPVIISLTSLIITVVNLVTR